MQVAAGDCHACALLSCAAAPVGPAAAAGNASASVAAAAAAAAGGVVKCWGCNGQGQLGLSPGAYPSAPRRPSSAATAARLAAGLPTGPAAWLASSPTVDLGAGVRVVALSAGGAHTCALCSAGRVRCWGDASRGLSGLGYARMPSDEPALARARGHPIRLGAGAAGVAALIASGREHVCVLLVDGGVKCWGGNSLGQLGYGDVEHRGDYPTEMGDELPVVALGGGGGGGGGGGAAVVALSAGGWHTCAIVAELGGRALRCWGANSWGELGAEDTAARGDRPQQMGKWLPAVRLGAGLEPTHVSAGLHFTCARLVPRAAPAAAASLKCWGSNVWGQLGYGDLDARGDAPGTMGDALAAVPLPAGLRARDALDASAAAFEFAAPFASASGEFACATVARRGAAAVDGAAAAADGAAVGAHCWPWPPPDGSALTDAPSRAPPNSTAAKRHARLDAPAALAAAIAQGQMVALETGFARAADLALGGRSVCARLDDGGVKCYGHNSAGQLGYGDRAERFVRADRFAIPPHLDVGGVLPAACAPAPDAAAPPARRAAARAPRAPSAEKAIGGRGVEPLRAAQYGLGYFETRRAAALAPPAERAATPGEAARSARALEPALGGARPASAWTASGARVTGADGDAPPAGAGAGRARAGALVLLAAVCALSVAARWWSHMDALPLAVEAERNAAAQLGPWPQPRAPLAASARATRLQHADRWQQSSPAQRVALRAVAARSTGGGPPGSRAML
jgi:alpha-tubulin suppressor-like RCC1 family protein